MRKSDLREGWPMSGLGRFAPTPSGFLHSGNVVNALLCSWHAKEHGAGLLLRIDDLDADRCRTEYEQDIVEVLGWLGIDFARVHRQTDDPARYLEGRERLERTGMTFACRCTRKSVANAVACDCTSLDLPLRPNETSLKWRGPSGDVVVWRRDDIPAFPLASVIDDEVMQITHIVRGEDLREATRVQQELATALDASHFLNADIRFHPLLLTPGGDKLSKSRLQSGPMTRNAETARAMHATARSQAAHAGITPAYDSRS